MITIEEAQALIKTELVAFPAGPDELDIRISVKDSPGVRGFVANGKRTSSGTTVTALPNPVQRVTPVSLLQQSAGTTGTLAS